MGLRGKLFWNIKIRKIKIFIIRLLISVVLIYWVVFMEGCFVILELVKINDFRGWVILLS